MRTDDFDYDLPPDLIAQHPVPRGSARLMVLDRSAAEPSATTFDCLPLYLRPGDTVVLNDTRVTARRVEALGLARGGEALLIRPVGDDAWAALVRPGRAFRVGATVTLAGPDGEPVVARVERVEPDGSRILCFPGRRERDLMCRAGVVPVPPYIHERLKDEDDYQTVYAREGGSAAAPTAGLHFTEEMLDRVVAAGAGLVRLTLHVGVDTFRPVKSEHAEHHTMHGEWYELGEEAADAVNATTGRVVAIGTTTVRALESAAIGDGRVRAGAEETRLYITPGYRYRVVTAMFTNFHLPRSTLLMMVSAFAGYERTMAAYRMAVRERFRFYSFGDAMLIL